ncbi:MAG TPA: hypothetical protein VFK03_00890 [Candidatus Saccharimonadales bacterium]|nr:hypothetical protein [Candidatus Saccharimonadales bacterium]
MQPDQPGDYWQEPTDDTSVPGLTEDTSESVQPNDDFQPIQWRASEYIHHDKQGMWFIGLALISAVLVAIAILLVHSYTFAVLVVVMAVAVGYMAGRPPREISYQLTGQGMMIGDKAFSYHDFSGFGVLNEGPLYSVVLIPTRRFMPSVNIYFPEDLGEQIVDVLGSILPMRDIKPDPVDRLSRKLRF